MSTVGLVTAVALGVAFAATFVPAVRAARTSTVLALADSARTPSRTAWLITLFTRLPVPLLLGLRLAARRPRRALLAMLSIAITVSGIVAAFAAHADLDDSGALAVDPARAERLDQVLLIITITLVTLAAVNAIVITWATALDARHASAVARALGATPATGKRRTHSSTAASRARRRRPRHPRRHHTVRRGRRRDHAPAALATPRRRTGHGARGRRARRHTGPHRRPPLRRRNPSIRARLKRDGDSRHDAGFEAAVNMVPQRTVTVPM